MTILIESAVESLDDALAAVEGGADRLELCANLATGGTTPSAELLRAVKPRVQIPVFAMIRPRGGSFVYSNSEQDAMRRDIDLARELGADGVVLGLLDDTGRVDVASTRGLLRHATDLPVTFHRAFDRVADQIAALETLIELGIARVLTSGGADSALGGADALRTLVAHADGRIRIMAGGGVRPHNARELVERTGVQELHARCELDPLRISAIRRAVGGH